MPGAGSACLALVGTTLTLVLPTHHMCPPGTPRLWNQHCLGIKVTCWAISISPVSLASPRGPHRPGLWSTLPMVKKIQISVSHPVYKLSPHTLSVLSLSTVQVPGQLEPSRAAPTGPSPSSVPFTNSGRQNLKADSEPTGESLGLARTELWAGRGSCPLSAETRPSIQRGWGWG